MVTPNKILYLMKFIFQKCTVKCLLLYAAILSVNTIWAQTCPPAVTTGIASINNTYFPGQQAIVSAGSTSIAIGAAAYGTIPVSAGDVLLIIQMQGAQINSANDNTYGDGVNGRGYLNNAQLLAGNMEYVVATNSVPVSGGTLTLQTGTVNNYKKAAFGTDGQYTYQLIRVPLYYNLVLGTDITAPSWDGSAGGVIVVAVMNIFNMNGKSLNVTGAGFRGGAGVQLDNGTGTNQDVTIVSPTDANISTAFGRHASKGEGIAGTPRHLNSNYSSRLSGTNEGYPGGSFGRGAPGNAGGGGSDDANPNNTRNSGGGGGGNGGAGGIGGNSFLTVGPYGGAEGAPFAQRSAARLVMGGGGGAGDNNDGTGTPNGGLASGGAAGGGIVIISTNSFVNSGTIYANGANANGSIEYDGSGGGGAGGSVLIYARSGHSNITVYANGGNGGSNFYDDFTYPPQHGPGGGGGGGIIYTNSTLNASSSANGGIAGTTNSSAGLTNYGAQAGADGISVTVPVMNFISGCMVLPMKFTAANGKRDGAQVLINWEVTDEEDLTNYIIERSNNGYEYSTVGIVGNKPENGKTAKYSFSDALAGKTAIIYYRIKAQNASGETFFSKVITIQTVLSKEEMLDISPVPAKRYTMIKWSATANSKLTISMFDVTGRFVMCRQYQLRKGVNELLLTNLEALPAGVYFIKASDGASYRKGKLRIQQ